MSARHPYVRGTLLRLWREARERLGDPVDAWACIVGDAAAASSYKQRRGRGGGFERASWDEVIELIAAAHVFTIEQYLCY